MGIIHVFHYHVNLKVGLGSPKCVYSSTSFSPHRVSNTLSKPAAAGVSSCPKIIGDALEEGHGFQRGHLLGKVLIDGSVKKAVVGVVSEGRSQ